MRRGTNGAVSLLGCAASVAGGLTMGLIFALGGGLSPAAGAKGAFQWALVPMGLGLGVFGSLLDSVLGATVQFSGLNTKVQGSRILFFGNFVLWSDVSCQVV